mgnify:CR=1 FL=1
MVTVSPRLGRVGETERAPCTGSVRIGGYRVGPEEAGRLTVTVQAAEASPALAVMVAVPGPTAVHHGNRLVAGGPGDARLGGIRRENRGLKGCGAACGEGECALIQDHLFHRDGGDGGDLHIGVLEDAGGQVVSVNLAGAAGL